MKTKRKLLLLSLFLYSIGQAQVSKTITVTSPGTLSTLFTDDELNTVTNLIVAGSIDARDFQIMRDKMPKLQNLDISASTINAYTGHWGTAYEDYGSPVTIYPANEIPISAFSSYYMPPLTTIKLPNSITSIGNAAFNNCRNLVGTLDIPSTVVKIGDNAFYRSKFTGVLNLPTSLTTIGEEAFSECLFSGNLVIPASVTSIGSSAFSNCWGFTGTLEIPSSVSTIAGWTFDNCNGLTSLIIPSSVTEIGLCAFQGCTSLTSIYSKTTAPVIPFDSSDMFNNLYKNNCALYVNYKMKSKYQTTPNWKEFANIVENTTGIFVDSSKLDFSAEPSSSIRMRVDANVSWEIINHFDWIKVIKENHVGVESLLINVDPNTSLSKRKAYFDLLDSNGETYRITVLQDAATKIVNCTPNMLNSLLTTKEKNEILKLKIIGSIDARDFKIIRDNLVSLESLDISEVKITAYTGFVDLDPDRWGPSYTYYAETLPASSFANNNSLTNILLPNSIIKIENKAFYYSKNIKSIVIPDLVKSLDAYAFYACDSLKSVNIGKSVTTIGSNCFAFCYALNKITATNPIPVILDASSYYFYGVNKSNCGLFVPDGSLTAYKAATVWKDFLNMSEITTGVQSINQSNIRVITARGKLRILNVELGGIAQIYSISGVKIKEQAVISGQTDIFLPSGVYVLRIGNFTDKILVK